MEGAIQLLFEGHLMNYIECVHMDYKSRRRESFYGILVDLVFLSESCGTSFCVLKVALCLPYLCMSDLQLDVKGCCDVYASFDKYVQVEHLDGDNKYRAEQHGLQVSS